MIDSLAEAAVTFVSPKVRPDSCFGIGGKFGVYGGESLVGTNGTLAP
jgi:hypothetical protein